MRVTEEELLCAIVDEYNGRVTKPVLHTVLYLYERRLCDEDKTQYQSSYEFVKSSWGVTAGRLEENVEAAVEEDILYVETSVDCHPSTAYTVDHRTKFETILDDVPDEARSYIQEVCRKVESADSVVDVVTSIPEIEAAEKYQQVTPTRPRRATR